MNTRPVLDSDKGPFALSASFNADNSCFSVALESGFRVFSSKSGDQRVARSLGGSLSHAEMLGTTRYLALIGGGLRPKFPSNKVQIYNDASSAITTSLELSAPIQRVRISQTHLIVVLVHAVQIYKMALPPSKIAEYETAPNPLGLCALGTTVVAFPGLTTGQLKIYHLSTGNVSIIPASSSSLRCIALSQDASRVATASEAGTLVRVWEVSSCTKVAELRRGVDPAVILGLAFSPSGGSVAVSSDKGTLHVFDLRGESSSGGSGAAAQGGGRPGAQAGEGTGADQHKWRLLSKLPLLPRQFSDTYSNCSCPFSLGDDYTHSSHSAHPTRSPHAPTSPSSAAPSTKTPGVPGARPTKGLLGWLDESTVICIGAGQDARWEKFVVGYDQGGKRAVWREGWRRYLE
ncbi:Phosphatidylinositol 3,5-bisphosphate-binding protein [Didymella heteroderae]|uniref:Phosphatidylinositol 3,5-bisphosphate-binding protein n=1 Tax=Didymella heteroderae TaxID=1769908 RepID=A0A9P5BXR4_9PLEO|nr:Phosphatidylinositol 3,5-bisphosphate-binding protein [Didymella heteroderae]